ncbi:MAG: 23S rRNA (guanosine(2251)-2'-O)-methyltransferase RlmB [bacterium]
MPKIFGRNPVFEALRAGQRSVEKVFLARGASGDTIEKISSLARARKIICENVSKERLDELAGYGTHQGVLAIVKGLTFKELPVIISELKDSTINPFFLIVDSVEDPRNLGALIRTASAAGVHAVIIPKRRSAGITEVVVKSSAGAVEWINCVRVSNLVNCCHLLKKQGIWIIGAESDADDLWYTVDYTLPLAIVVGGEGKGLSRLLRAECDFLVSMPMKSAINSLNISVAAGILMYEVLRQRNLHITGAHES